MTALDDLARCRWHPPGGAEAALVIARFLGAIGIAVRVGPVGEGSFVPGLAIHRGAIIVDPETPAWPGDLLHEAGHIAVLPEALRGDGCVICADAGDELTAIAWSWAAAQSCGIAADVLFHAEGYRGGSADLIGNFTSGCYFGVPLLSAWGMTAEPRTAAARGVVPYPGMQRWLR